MKKATQLILTIFTGIVLMVFSVFFVHAADDLGIKEQKTNDIVYISGGVGHGERDILEKEAGKYNLKVILAAVSGDYLADVKVIIKDTDGKLLLETLPNGPWLFIKLSEGAYKITASLEGREQTKTINVSSGLKTVKFSFKL